MSHNKPNLSIRADDTLIRLVNVNLPNAEPPRYPSGDGIGVADQLMVRPFMSLFKTATIKAVLDKIASGTYKASGRDGEHDYKAEVAAALSADFPNETQDALKKTAVLVVTQLLAEGKLVKAEVTFPRYGGGKGGGKKGEGLTVNWAATEWAATPGPAAEASPNAEVHPVHPWAPNTFQNDGCTGAIGEK